MKIKCTIFLIVGCFPLLAIGELAIIANYQNSVEEVTKEQISNIYLGKSNLLPNGNKVVPLDQMEGQAAREEFYEEIVGKNEPQMNSYWSKLIFSGKGKPPFKVSGNQEMIEFISVNPNMIGYIDLDSVESGERKNIKVLLKIE